MLDSAGSFGLLSRFHLFSSAAPPIPCLSDRRHLAQAPSKHLPVGYPKLLRSYTNNFIFNERFHQHVQSICPYVLLMKEGQQIMWEPARIPEQLHIGSNSHGTGKSDWTITMASFSFRNQ